jgi:hypothetical protein
MSHSPKSLLPHSSTITYPGAKKVAIIGMEIDVDLVAQYNPKEITFEKSAGWTPIPGAKANNPDLEYGSSPARTLSMELFFDGYEEDVDVSEVYVAKLMQLINVMDPDGDEQRKRPTVVQVRWPHDSTKFTGVLSSVSTKYTMFNPDGKPVRATCSIKVTEATRTKDAVLPRIQGKRADGW